MSGKYVLAIDQGTTSSRAILFDQNLVPVATGQQEFTQFFPDSGWVEHDADEIWQTTLSVCRDALMAASAEVADVVALGITNQRETVVVWDRHTGQPVSKAIVWQDRRTASICADLKAKGYEDTVTEKTGLLLDPYFSGSKLGWMLDNIDGLRARAEQGDVLFGTIDSFLIWRLTAGAAHVTDATNAARTMLYNIGTGQWDDDMLAMFNIPRAMLPEVRDCATVFGTVAPNLLGAGIPILGVAGDQHAATLGQACFEPGMLKSTYGTGCFALLNTGDKRVHSKNRLLGTIAYQLNGKPTYALEGSIFVAGAVVQWLRDGLHLIEHAKDTQDLVQQANPNEPVVLVPAFVGLGAPYWHADCRGAVFGLTRNTGRAEMAAAALESVGYQTRDLLEAMYADWAAPDDQPVLRVDGGMSANDWAMQFLSDITGGPVDRPKVLETTAVGAAWLAGMQTGFYPGMDEFAATWALERRFDPKMAADIRDVKYARWKRAVAATLTV